MSISIIIGILIVAVVLWWGYKAQQKEAHHLDGLHITPHGEDPKKP